MVNKEVDMVKVGDTVWCEPSEFFGSEGAFLKVTDIFEVWGNTVLCCEDIDEGIAYLGPTAPHYPCDSFGFPCP